MASNKLDILKLELDVLEDQKKSMTGFFYIKNKNEKELEILTKKKKIAEEEYNKIKKAGNNLDIDAIKTKYKALQDADKAIDKEKKINENRKSGLDILTKNYWFQTGILKSLNDQDKIIRQTILNLGLSGNKAFEMRKSFENAAANAALIGANLEDILKIQTGFSDETGRAQVLTNDMVNDVLLIGKGTAIGVEQATKLASQFQIMGIDTKRTMEYVQGIVDTSERMGINTTKVLNNIANNFKKLQTMNFNTGVQGYAKMAEYAEQMKIDMAESMQSSKMANNLEKSIDLAAQLQVMGGEFAKIDPFQMLYFSRNAPEEFQKRMNEITKGLVTFRKMADGTFEKFISPADRDRMEAVAKATGVSIENLTEQALRMADASKIKQMLLGTGFSAKDKELITGQATFDNKLGKFLVQVGTARKDISALNSEDIKSLQVQQSALEVRAKDALTFNESLQSMIDALKTTLIPLMRGMTTILEPLRDFVRLLSNTSDGFKNTMGSLGKFLGYVLLVQGALKLSTGIYNSIMMAIAAAKGTSFIPKNGSLFSGWTNKVTRDKGGRFLSNKNAGLGAMRGGIGIGAAGLGIGGGIGIAAGGISLLADAMSKLTPEQAKTLNSIVMTLSIATAVIPLVAVGIAALGGTVALAMPELLALGGAVALIGAGVGVAGYGIEQMADGFSKLVESSKGADMGLVKVAAGIAAINLAMGATGIVGAIGSLFGGSSLEKTLNSIGNNAEKISVVGEAFKQINTVLTASKDDFSAIESAINSISNMNTSKGSAFAQLADLLSKPIQVEFSDKKVAIVSNITLEMDGEKIMQKAYRADARIQRDNDVKLNKLGK